ncbi:MAG TPA: multidrug effflux MFS transporter [Rhodanobacteraceae bacterium]|nr:multidrug effflux MFS transporter [Rhodanobacteraceae bacterium]
MEPHIRHRGALVALLAALSMIGPFSIDTMFPGFPAMARDFGASPLAMQQTVSVYLLAYALMSVVHGPLSDALGRRLLIVVGMAGYALASAGAALAQGMDALLAWRALQGVCAGAGIVVGRAVIRDLFDGAAAQRLMSQVTMIFGIAPAIAPVVGAQLLLIGGWHGIFWALTAFALLLVAGTLAWLPESHPPERRQPLQIAGLVRSWGCILGDRGFWPLAISGTCNFSALFLFIASAPAVVLDRLHLSAQSFPWLFVPVIGGIMSGAWLSSRLAGKRSAAVTVNLAYALMLFGNAMNLLLVWVSAAAPPAWTLLPLYFCGIGVGLASPTLTLLLIDRFPALRGSASSMQAFVSLLFNALVAGAISPWLSGHLLHLALGAAAIELCGWLAWCVYARIARGEVARHEAASAAEAAAVARPIEPG